MKSVEQYDASLVGSQIHAAINELSPDTFKGMKVLIKPNILSASEPDSAVTTHPLVVEAVVRWFKKKGCVIKVGDSPAIDPYKKSCEKTGIAAVCKREKVELVEFNKTSSYTNSKAKYVKRFQLTKELEWADFVVTVPKLKNHLQMYYTGALKNMFGLVSGIAKSKYHIRFVERKVFAGMIVDLNLLAKPGLAVIDAVYSMEGDGPRNGSPRHTGFIGASLDPLALDLVCAKIIGYDALKIPMLHDALSRKEAWIHSQDEIELRGDFKSDFVIKDFKKIGYVKDVAFLRNALPGFAYHFLRNLLIPSPVFNHKKCIRCLKCVKICSAEALTLVDGKISIQNKRCIKCFCCHEVCPEDAISLR